MDDTFHRLVTDSSGKYVVCSNCHKAYRTPLCHRDYVKIGEETYTLEHLLDRVIKCCRHPDYWYSGIEVIRYYKIKIIIKLNKDLVYNMGLFMKV
jgi:hypothetical protein